MLRPDFQSNLALVDLWLRPDSGKREVSLGGVEHMVERGSARLLCGTRLTDPHGNRDVITTCERCAQLLEHRLSSHVPTGNGWPLES